MRVDAFDYLLPPELIATEPIEPRDSSRLLLYRRADKKIEHYTFRDLPRLLNKGDLLVFNNSRVIPARLKTIDEKEKPLELLLLEPETAGQVQTWRVLVKPGRRVKGSVRTRLSDGSVVEVDRVDLHNFTAKFPEPRPDFYSWLETVGEPPIPPYFKRAAVANDRQRYQTVYARPPGSVAAPTAGLHFTPELMNDLEAQKIDRAFVTLHVGYGTFAPIGVEDLSEHSMHFESYSIDDNQAKAIQGKKEAGERVIPVGTTALRTLESISKFGVCGRTDIFITPGHKFDFSDGLITNFHLPKSTLFVLVASLIGLEEAKRCYQVAVEERYRFFSYGDAMLIL